MLDTRRALIYNVEWIKRKRWRKPTRAPKMRWKSAVIRVWLHHQILLPR